MEKLSLIVGAVGTIFSILCFQAKKQDIYLFDQIMANLMTSASFLLLGFDRLSGGLLCFAALFQALLNYWFIKHDKGIAKWSIALFFFIYVGVTLVPVFFQGNIRFPYSFCTFFCAMAYLVGISSKKGKTTRICGLVNVSFWLTYDLLGIVFPIANFVTHIAIAISTVTGMIRYDFRPKSNVF